MYTVIRFIKDGDRQTLTSLGEKLNTESPGLFTGFSHVGDLFSCNIEFDGDYWAHRASILGFVEQFGDILASANESDVKLQLDMAVSSEDLEAPVVTMFLIDEDMMAKLLQYRISLVLSFYS